MHSLRFAVAFLVLLLAAACGSGDYAAPPTSSPSPVPSGSPSSVSIQRGAEALADRAYLPAELIIVAGTTVTWTNTDSVSHTTTSDRPGWNSGTVAPGGQFSTSFQTPGTFPYHCSIHPGMTATVTVR